MGRVSFQATNSYTDHVTSILSGQLVAVLFPAAMIFFDAEDDANTYRRKGWNEKLELLQGAEKRVPGPWNLTGLETSTLQRLDGKSMAGSQSHPLRDRVCREALLALDKDPVRRTALEAGLWLWIDELDRSHTASQSREGEKTCDAWHMVMHRREGDFWNAKYWVRRVGRHPSHDRLWASLEAIERKLLTNSQERVYGQIMSQKYWRGETMVDLCEEFAADQEGEEGVLLRAVQQLEMVHLLAS